MWKFVFALLSFCILTSVSVPSQAQQTDTSAARRAGNARDATDASAALPPALRAAVEAGNASAVMAAINTLSGGNAAKRAELAFSVISAAEGKAARNPLLSANITAAASQTLIQPAVMQAAPQMVFNAILAANRIAISPAVQRAAPSFSAAISINTITCATTPAVYAISPQAALQVMSDGYNSVSSPTIANAAPNALKSVTRTLTAASVNPQLATLLQQNGSIITSIMAKQPLPDNIRIDAGPNNITSSPS